MGKGNLQDKFINKEKYDKIQQVVEETRWPLTTIERKRKIDGGYKTQKMSPQ